MAAAVAGKGEESKTRAFLSMCHYVSGTSYGDNEAWKNVSELAAEKEKEFGQSEDANRLFYFAIPPSVFADAGAAIRAQAMSSSGWSRMIVEKPFGHDSESSAKLSAELGNLFTEKQLYRIDHYLGKELVQNLMVLRFANSFLEPIWNRNYVSCVVISFKEDIGTDGRGGYFDKYGIIRDVMQNHLLQVLSLVAMEPPVRVVGSDSSEFIRDEKVKALRAIPPLKLEDVILGQYTASADGKNRGYLDDETVPNDSVTPTYALAKFSINNSRWAGVPFIIKCGKALDSRKMEVRMQLRQPPGVGSLFDGCDVQQNELVMRVQPNEAIYMKCNVKMPGFTSRPVETELDLSYNLRFADMATPNAYTRLILDVLRGKQSTFVRTDELEAAWAIFTPLLHQIEGERVVPTPYAFGSRGPLEADDMMEKYYQRSTAYTWEKSGENAQSGASAKM